MLPRVPLVDGPQGEDINAAMHHIAVHEPLDEVSRQEHRDDQEPLPGRALDLPQAIPDCRGADPVHDADVQ
ncbi:hypothetical protein D3C87_1799570 [compost metagenome]